MARRLFQFVIIRQATGRQLNSDLNPASLSACSSALCSRMAWLKRCNSCALPVGIARTSGCADHWPRHWQWPGLHRRPAAACPEQRGGQSQSRHMQLMRACDPSLYATQSSSQLPSLISLACKGRTCHIVSQPESRQPDTPANGAKRSVQTWPSGFLVSPAAATHV